jgi:hypothetical protein
MAIEPTKEVLIKFFALDVLNQKERKIKNITSSDENSPGKLENEWLQEYELIYSLQELEDWNLEEPHRTPIRAKNL